MGAVRAFRARFATARVFAPLALGSLFAGLVGLADAASPAPSAEEGQTIFQQKCVSCHTIGGGRLVGPDLQGVTARRGREWLTRMISAPDKMLAGGDPIATQLLREHNNVPMPNQGLTEDQARSVIAYLGLQVGGAPAGQAPALPFVQGDPVAGKDLFTGVIRFQNGGPACMACHSIAGIGALGGGALGPDLTPAYTKFGEAGLASVLARTPFPTMNPIFSSRPLTAQEQANLRTFLQRAAVAKRPVEAVGQLAGLAAVGAGVLLALTQLSWRRRLTEVRRPLTGRMQGKNSVGSVTK